MVDHLNMPVGLSYLSHLNFPHKIGILERLYGKRLGRHGECWVTIDSGLEWKLDLSDATQRWIVYDSYEGRNITAWIRSLFRDGGIAIESGSNIGQTLLYYADLADRIIAIEPLQTALDWLSECKDHNQLANIELLNAGLADKKSKLVLQQAGAQSTFRSDWYKNKNHNTVEIDCYSLDDITRQYEIDQIRFWKLDVEGMEPQALQGAHTLLSNKKIDTIYIEITGGNFDKVRTLLEKYDYGLFFIDDQLRPYPVYTPVTQHTTVYICLPNNN